MPPRRSHPVSAPAGTSRCRPSSRRLAEVLLIVGCAFGCQSVPQAQHIAFVGFDESADVYESQALATNPKGGLEAIQLRGEDCTARVFAIRFGRTPTCQRALQQARDQDPKIRVVRNLVCREDHSFFKQCTIVTGRAYQ